MATAAGTAAPTSSQQHLNALRNYLEDRPNGLIQQRANARQDLRDLPAHISACEDALSTAEEDLDILNNTALQSPSQPSQIASKQREVQDRTEELRRARGRDGYLRDRIEALDDKIAATRTHIVQAQAGVQQEVAAVAQANAAGNPAAAVAGGAPPAHTASDKEWSLYVNHKEASKAADAFVWHDGLAPFPVNACN